jgi:acetolactate synthase-1/3 small subunit
MENKLYTITVFTENHIGLLNRITIIFTRRHVNIESLTVSESEIHGIHRFTIVVNTTETQVQKIVRQIEKQVEVIRSSYYTDDEVVHQEVALYKVDTKALAHGNNVERLIRENNAHILDVEPDYIVIEKTGHPDETQALFKRLEPFGVLQFVRSGRIAITKQIRELTSYLKDLDEVNKTFQNINNN